MREVAEATDALVRLREAQLARWQQGQRVQLEELLAEAASPPLTDEELLDLIYSEVLLREEFGDRPTREEYQRRFPRLGEAIARQLELHAALSSLESAPPQAAVGPPPPGLSTVSGTGVAPVPSATDHDPDKTRLESPGAAGGGAPPLSAEAALPAITGYEILGVLGRGGMGVVYKARHLRLNRLVALKMILAAEHAGTAELTRFQTEAEAVARLQHPNIVQIHEVGEQQGLPYFSLEFMDGGSLADRLDGTPLPERQAARLVEVLARAVHAAHQKRVLHRDLKPGNVLLARSDAGNGIRLGNDPGNLQYYLPKITDFGLAKKLDVAVGPTQSGAPMGSPPYMAREQAAGQGKEIGPPTDVYALGAVLYELLTGRPPFKAATIMDTILLVLGAEPVPPGRLQPKLARDLETICLKCLDKEPGRRYGSAEELAEDLRRFQAGEPIRARPAGTLERTLKWVRRRPAAAALVAVSAAAVLGMITLGAFFTVRLQGEKQTALEQRDEAIRQRGRAAHNLAVAVAAVNDIAKDARSAKTGELATGNTGMVLFELACSYARASSKLRADENLDLEDRRQLAEQYAVSAVNLLKCAKDVGFFRSDRPRNRRELENNAGLACLRERGDFKDFEASLR